MPKNNTSNDKGESTFDAKNGDATAGASKTGSAKGQGVGDMARDASEKFAETAQQVREKVTQQTQAAARATAETLESNPFGAVAGAIAIGAVAAALIPASRRELEALGPITDRVKGYVEEAYHAARDAGSSELTAAGLTAAAATNGFGGVIGALIKTATTAAGVAATTMRERRAAEGGNATSTTSTPGSSQSAMSNDMTGAAPTNAMPGDDMATAQS